MWPPQPLYTNQNVENVESTNMTLTQSLLQAKIIAMKPTPMKINRIYVIGNSQFCWQVCWRVVLAFDNIIALVQSLEDREGVTDAVNGRQVLGQKFSGRGSRSTANQARQLLHQFLLRLLHVHLVLIQRFDRHCIAWHGMACKP